MKRDLLLCVILFLICLVLIPKKFRVSPWDTIKVEASTNLVVGGNAVEKEIIGIVANGSLLRSIGMTGMTVIQCWDYEKNGQVFWGK